MKEEIAGRKPDYGFFSRLAYGVGEIFGGGCFVIINAFFIVFLTDALGMPAALAGTIPLAGKVWDAITDPVMGNIVERTHSKFGAKRFYILIGSFASAILSMLLLIVAVIFPMTSGEYDLVIREVARRKGVEKGEATEEEKKTLERVTGFSYDRLWNRENAGLKESGRKDE